jgi:hypothetical protein
MAALPAGRLIEASILVYAKASSRAFMLLRCDSDFQPREFDLEDFALKSENGTFRTFEIRFRTIAIGQKAGI